MTPETISDLYFEQVLGENAALEGATNRNIESSTYFKKFSNVVPSKYLKATYDHYRIKYEEFGSDEHHKLNIEIMDNGITLPRGISLFHGRGSELSYTNRPISCSTHPSKAIWHARKHRNFELNGAPIYIYLINVISNFKIRAVIDFQDFEYGHENEVLLQAGVILIEKWRKDLSSGVFVINCEV